MSAYSDNRDEAIVRLAESLCDYVEVYGIDSSDETAFDSALTVLAGKDYGVINRMRKMIDHQISEGSISSDNVTISAKVELISPLSIHQVPGKELNDIARENMPELGFIGWNLNKIHSVEFNCLPEMEELVGGWSHIKGTVKIMVHVSRVSTLTQLKYPEKTSVVVLPENKNWTVEKIEKI